MKKKKETELEYIQRVLLSSKVSWRHQFSTTAIYNDLKDNLEKLDLETNKYPFLIDFKRKINGLQKFDRNKIEDLILELKDRMNYLRNPENKKNNITQRNRIINKNPKNKNNRQSR